MQSCKACEHPELKMINLGIQRGLAIITLAKRFALTEDVISRHRANHVDLPEVAPAVDPKELLVTLMSAKKMAEDIANDAQSTSNQKIEALREIRQVTESIAKLTGAYKQTDPKHLLPFWGKMRMAILKALQPYPEAREAVLNALEQEVLED